MAMKPTTISILNYLKENSDMDLTSQDLADIFDLSKRQVDGAFTQAIQRKGYGVRVPAEVEMPNGTHKKVNYLKLTPEGLNFNPEETE